MEKFKVPQQLDRASKLFGPVSATQLVTLVVGGIIAYVIYITFAPITPAILHIPPVVIVIGITLAFTFIEIEGIHFGKVLLVLFERLVNPSKRTFSGIPPRKKIS